MPARAAVVGGGVSGLIAARELARSGVSVTVFEADTRLGGRIHGVGVDGATGLPDATGVETVPVLDIGAESFATRGGTVARVLTELGLESEIVFPAPLGSWLVMGGRAFPLPPAGTLGIPTSPLSAASFRALGPVGAVRAAAEKLIPRRAGDTGSLASIVSSRLGTRVLERLVRPVCLGVYSAHPEQLSLARVPGLADAYERTGSLRAAAREVRGSQQAAGGAVGGLRGGMGALVRSLKAELERLDVTVRMSAAVTTVTAADAAGSERVQLRVDGADEWFDGVILAVPENEARRIAQAGADATAGDTIEIVVLVLDEPRLDAAPRGTGALVVSRYPDDASGNASSDKPMATGDRARGNAAPIRAKALTHVTAKWPERARDFGQGRHVLRLSYGRVGAAPATRGLSDDEVRALAIDDASRILGIELATTSLRGMARHTWSVPRTPPSAARSEDTHRTWIPQGVEVAGDWVSGPGLASVIPGARSAAERVLAPLYDPPGQADPEPTPSAADAASAGDSSTADNNSSTADDTSAADDTKAKDRT